MRYEFFDGYGESFAEDLPPVITWLIIEVGNPVEAAEILAKSFVVAFVEKRFSDKIDGLLSVASKFK